MYRLVPALVAGSLLLPALALGQQQMYRYTDKDGRIVYTDQSPPAGARNVQQKKLNGNYVESTEPFALQYAQQRNPVTLYSGNCGPLCDSARALLNRRGVPYKEVDPTPPAEQQKLKQLSGDLKVPVLLIGAENVLKGFEEDRWQSALDSAGYPKTPALRITQLKRDAAGKAVAGSTKAGGASDAKGAPAAADSKVDGGAEAKNDDKAAPTSEAKKAP